MRKRLLTLLAAFGLLCGLAVVPIIAAEEATAYPATGSHTISAKCDNGTYHASLEFNYTISFVSYDSILKMNNYSFQLNSSKYTSATSSSNRPDLRISFDGSSNGPLWLASTKGGSQLKEVWPQWTAVAPVTTRINGLAGVAWTPFSIRMSTTGSMAENVGRISFGSPHTMCTQEVDLSLPNGPIEGPHGSQIMTCTANGVTNTFALDYWINKISDDTYSIRMTGYQWLPNAPNTNIDVYLEDSEGVQYPLDTDHPILTVYPAGFVQEGLAGTPTNHWGTYNFQAVQGHQAPAIHAVFYDDEGTCSSKLNVGTVFSGETGTTIETVHYDDCVGGMGGFVTFTATWKRTEAEGNGSHRIYPTSVKATVSAGDAKLVFDAGTETVNGGLTYSRPGSVVVSTANSVMNIAERTVTIGETQTWNISHPAYWSPRDTVLGTYRAPAVSGFPDNGITGPAFRFLPHVVVQDTGVECVNAWAPGGVPLDSPDLGDWT